MSEKEITTTYTPIRVKKIIHESDDNYCIFTGVTCKKMPRKKIYKDLTETNIYAGYFKNIVVDDIYEVNTKTQHSTFHGDSEFVVSYRRVYPAIEAEIKKFLISRRKKIGEKRAEDLVGKYGTDTLNAIRQDVNVLIDAGVPEKQANEFRNELLLENVYEEVLTLFQLYDIHYSYAIPIFQQYKGDAALILRAEPYTPCLDGIYSFYDADRIHGLMGRDPCDRYRIATALIYMLRELAKGLGDVCIEKEDLLLYITAFFNRLDDTHENSIVPYLTKKYIEDSLEYLAEKKLVTIDENLIPGKTLVYLYELFESEAATANNIHELMSADKRINISDKAVCDFLVSYNNDHPVQLSNEQKRAVRRAVKCPMFILTGGPGTGKTQTINAIIETIERFSDKAKIMLAAPTGKAANRMHDLTNKPAYTIHRLFGINGFGGADFSSNTLVCDYLIVDEFSMVDIDLAGKMLSRLSKAAHLIVVGDINQLPPVGPGLPLKDLIASSKIETVQLTHIFRQDNCAIVHNSAAVLQSHGNLKVDASFQIRTAASSEINDVMWKEIQDLLNSGYSIDDIQVLSPIKKGNHGTYRLNDFLQEKINGSDKIPSYEHKNKLFKLNDRVIQTVNDYDLSVFNGETGYISDINYLKGKAIEVTFPDKKIWYKASQVHELDMAYAITVHKSQGNEFPVVILPVTKELARNIYKSLLFTAISRAKKKFVIIGQIDALKDAIQNTTDIRPRKSELVNRI